MNCIIATMSYQRMQNFVSLYFFMNRAVVFQLSFGCVALFKVQFIVDPPEAGEIPQLRNAALLYNWIKMASANHGNQNKKGSTNDPFL